MRRNELRPTAVSSLERKRNLKRNTIPAFTMAGPVTLWMIVFVLLPLIYVIFISFMKRDAFGGIDYHFTVMNYVEILQPVYLRVIWKSIKLAFLTTAICLLIGYPMAYYIARKPSRLAAKLLMLVMIPFWTNTLVRLYSINLMGQPNGFLSKLLMSAGIISKPLDILYSDGIVIVGLLISMLPFAILPLYASIEKLDKAYLEASSDLGARPAITFWRVTVPLTLPGIIASVILVFIPSLGMYYVPEALGGGKVMLIGSLIRNQFLVTKNWPFGASLSILLVLITLLMLWIYTRVARLDEMEVF